MAEQWLTYQQAGKLFGVSSEAIRRHATRYAWRRQKGNDGKALVLVTEREAGQIRTRPDGRPPERPDGQPQERPGGQLSGRPSGQAGEAATIADMMTTLVADRRTAEADAVTARQEAEQLRERAAHAEGERDGLREALRRADAAVAEGHRRVDEAGERLRESHERLERAQAATREARERLEQHRRERDAEATALRDDAAHERGRAERADAAREAAERELAVIRAGGPVRRALRAFLNRRERP